MCNPVDCTPYFNEFRRGAVKAGMALRCVTARGEVIYAAFRDAVDRDAYARRIVEAGGVAAETRSLREVCRYASWLYAGSEGHETFVDVDRLGYRTGALLPLSSYAPGVK